MGFDNSGFPHLRNSIIIDKKIHVKLQCQNRQVPLPNGLTGGRNAKLTRFSMLENFSSYLNEIFEKRLPSILEELINVEYYKGKGRPSYSVRVIRYALLYNDTLQLRLTG